MKTKKKGLGAAKTVSVWLYRDDSWTVLARQSALLLGDNTKQAY